MILIIFKVKLDIKSDLDPMDPGACSDHDNGQFSECEDRAIQVYSLEIKKWH